MMPFLTLIQWKDFMSLRIVIMERDANGLIERFLQESDGRNMTRLLRNQWMFTPFVSIGDLHLVTFLLQ